MANLGYLFQLCFLPNSSALMAYSLTSEFIKAYLLTYKLAFRVRDGNFITSNSCDKEMEYH